MSKFKPRGWSQFEYKRVPGVAGPVGDGGGWVNCHYIVQVSTHCFPGYGEVTHLWIRNNDGSTRHDWAELQRIKDELVGKHCVGIEVFPPADKLIDSANMYHLWCWPASRVPFPFVAEGHFER